MTDIVNIPETEKRYKDEWLLFDVTETGELGEPLSGRLLYHHPDRDAVHEVDMRLKPHCAYVVFAGPPVENGYVAVL